MTPEELEMEVEVALSDFVKSKDVSRAIALALTSKKNLLLWGPGGHGKSEMVLAALSAVTKRENVFIQSFGEGMDEAQLWGGLDLRALQEENVLRYHPENSFLNSEYAVLEELFDAPSSVLLALKDTLTARCLRKGAQQFPMNTRVIIACTNHDPRDLAGMGSSVQALMERFPLQLKVAWSSYNEADYRELIRAVERRSNGIKLNGSEGVLTSLLAKVSEVQPVSPRVVIDSVAAVKASAAMRGSSEVEKVDLLDLRFVPGFSTIVEKIAEELDVAFRQAAATQALELLFEEFERLRICAKATPIAELQRHKKLLQLLDKVGQLRIPEAAAAQRDALRTAVQRAADTALKGAVAGTNV